MPRPILLLAVLALPAVSPAVVGQAANTWRLPGSVDSEFGAALDGTQDLDGDGITDLLIGSPLATVSGSPSEGRAQVRSGADPSVVLLELDGEAADGAFGASVAWLGDLNDDDVPDFAVGAPGERPNSPADEAFVSVISGADGSEISRLSPRRANLYGGDFELPVAIGAPWSLVGGVLHGTSSLGGLPTSGAGYELLSAAGSSGATPPTNPGGFGNLPVGARTLSQEFRISDGQTVLAADLVLLTTEVQGAAFNDFISLHVRDGSSHFNVATLDTTTPYVGFGTLPSVGTVNFTAVVNVSLDIASAFPSADTDSVFTLIVSAGNAVDSEGLSFAGLDNVRLEPGNTSVAAGSEALDHGHWFGWDVAPAGDITGDGLVDILVGAPGVAWTAGGTEAAGAAYVFSGADGTLLSTFEGGADDSRFGASVSCPGDVDGDGTPDLLVGSGGSDPVGGVLLSGADFGVLGSFSADEAAVVAGGGDLDGDGRADWLAGESEQNRVRHFDADSSTLFDSLGSDFLVGEAGENLGADVLVVGDVDGDGVLDVAASSTALDQGVVRVFSGATGEVLFEQDGDGVLNTALGTALAVVGDHDLDGFADLLVGDPAAASGTGEVQLVHGGNPWHITPGMRLDLDLEAGQTHTATLAGGLGERLSLTLKAGKKDGIEPELRLVGPLPAETEVLAAADSVVTDKLARAKVELPANGSYRLEIVDASGDGGSYKLTTKGKLAKVKDDIAAAAPGDADLQLIPGKATVVGTLDEGDVSRASFHASKGSLVTLELTSDKTVFLVPGLRLLRVSGDAELELVGTDATLQSVTQAGVSKFVLPVSGTYIIEMSSLIDVAGEFELQATVKLPKGKRTIVPPEAFTPDE